MSHLGAPFQRMTPDRCWQLTLAKPLSLEPLAMREQSIEVVRLCGHTQLAADLRDRLALLQQDLRLTQPGDNLLGAVSLVLHLLSLPPQPASQPASQPRIVTFGLDRNYGERSALLVTTDA